MHVPKLVQWRVTGGSLGKRVRLWLAPSRLELAWLQASSHGPHLRVSVFVYICIHAVRLPPILPARRGPAISFAHDLAGDIPIMAHFLDTPRTERGDQTRMSQTGVDFTELESFQAPAGRDNLFNPSNGARTPRNPLAALRNPAAKAEFTPLMKSATTNRTRQVNGLLKGGIATPAALKKGFELGGTPLPEASTMNVMSSSFVSESGVGNQTFVPQADSSDLSTPMALHRRPEGEFDDGKGLTLREQEAVRTLRNKASANGEGAFAFTSTLTRTASRANRQGKLWTEAQDPLSGREPEEDGTPFPEGNHGRKRHPQVGEGPDDARYSEAHQSAQELGEGRRNVQAATEGVRGEGQATTR